MSGQHVAVAGDEAIAAAVEAAGGVPVAPDDAASAAIVVAAGEGALVDVARRGVDAPVLPVDAGAGTRSVPAEAVTAAVEGALAGDCRTEPVSLVRAGGEGVALFDVALLAAEPARISEFSIRYRGDRLTRFRADGVVASTPAGSVGYNRAADGPLLAPGAGLVAVVPIAPFQTTTDRWVLPPETVAVAVERDETPVEVLVDGRVERTVSPGDPVSLALEDGIDLLVVGGSRSFF
jgi:NAD+ kinase